MKALGSFETSGTTKPLQHIMTSQT